MRAAQRRQIDAAVAAWAAGRGAEQAMAELQEAGVPAGKVQHIGDLIETDPQHRARYFWRPVTHDLFGERVTDTFSAPWDGERPPVERLSPAYLGEHNFEVFSKLAGLSQDAIAEGMADGLFN